MDEERLSNIKEALENANKHTKEKLVSRPSWGEIDFATADKDFDRIFEIIANLTVLPIEELTESAADQITAALNKTATQLEEIDAFSIASGDPGNTRDALVQALHSQAENLQQIASPHIPYLMFKKGDVATNIKNLAQAVEDGRQTVADAKSQLEGDLEEIEGIKEQARQAAGEAGVAVFTQEFQEEANTNESDARPWLIAAGGFAAVTLVAAIVMWVMTFKVPAPTGSELQILGTKFAILGVLFTTTLWCGRMYRALMHQRTVNRHKALSLQTFQAFSAAADDPATKDAVLIETTRAIFDAPATGLVDSQKLSSDNATTFVETIKSTTSRS